MKDDNLSDKLKELEEENKKLKRENRLLSLDRPLFLQYLDMARETVLHKMPDNFGYFNYDMASVDFKINNYEMFSNMLLNSYADLMRHILYILDDPYSSHKLTLAIKLNRSEIDYYRKVLKDNENR